MLIFFLVQDLKPGASTRVRQPFLENVQRYLGQDARGCTETARRAQVGANACS